MCETNPREVGVTPNDLPASFHRGPPWRHFAATSFHHLHLLPTSESSGKTPLGEPWIPAAYPPNTSLFSPLQVLTPPEAQPEPSSSGNSPRSHSPSCGGWAAGGHCSLDATLLPPLGSLAPSSLMASQPFLRSPSLAWAWGVNISREQGRVCMQASER